MENEEQVTMPLRTGELELRTFIKGLNICCKHSDTPKEIKEKVNGLCLDFLRISKHMEDIEEQHNGLLDQHKVLEIEYEKVQKERSKIIEAIKEVLGSINSKLEN